ncbi:MAG TPA: ABC transporter permease subunit [Verrucomicrobiae bacterium]
MRKLRHRLFWLLTAFCASLACGILLLLVGAIAFRGWPAISWNFFTEQIRLVGASGGIFYNLIGTLILITTALVTCLPIAFGIGLLCGVYQRQHKWRSHLMMLLYLLNGVPSILFGLFGLIVFVKFFGWGKSWLSGGILLGIMMLPTVTVAFIERIEGLPAKYFEAAKGLGLTTTQVVWSVIIPQSLSGLITGSLLGLVRAATETAPIMFTATVFAGATVPHGVKENPVLSLPYHIFILAQDSFDPAVGAKIWGTALVLVGLALLLSLLALPLRLRIHEEARHH